MNFLKGKNVSKSLLYFSTEIIIVTIGIYIAIKLNNWNQYENNKKEEINALKRIKADLEVEKVVLDNSLRDIKKSENYLTNILFNSIKKDLDSLDFHMSTTFRHYKFNSEYINLKHSGKLNLISNDSIRYLVVGFYEGYYGYYDETSETHKEFVRNYVQKYSYDTFEVDTTGLINAQTVKSKLNEKNLKNLLILQNNNYKEIQKNVNTEYVEYLLLKINKLLK
jgi:hypothetical protein